MEDTDESSPFRKTKSTKFSQFQRILSVEDCINAVRVMQVDQAPMSLSLSILRQSSRHFPEQGMRHRMYVGVSDGDVNSSCSNIYGSVRLTMSACAFYGAYCDLLRRRGLLAPDAHPVVFEASHAEQYDSAIAVVYVVTWDVEAYDGHCRRYDPVNGPAAASASEWRCDETFTNHVFRKNVSVFEVHRLPFVNLDLAFDFPAEEPHLTLPTDAQLCLATKIDKGLPHDRSMYKSETEVQYKQRCLAALLAGAFLRGSGLLDYVLASDCMRSVEGPPTADTLFTFLTTVANGEIGIIQSDLDINVGRCRQFLLDYGRNWLSEDLIARIEGTKLGQFKNLMGVRRYWFEVVTFMIFRLFCSIGTSWNGVLNRNGVREQVAKNKQNYVCRGVLRMLACLRNAAVERNKVNKVAAQPTAQ
jgi:hypothetical protein